MKCQINIGHGLTLQLSNELALLISCLVTETCLLAGTSLLRRRYTKRCGAQFLTSHGLLFRSMHDLRCKTTYVASYRTEGCAMHILLAYLLGGLHGIQTKIIIFLTKNLSLTEVDAIVVVEFCVIRVERNVTYSCRSARRVFLEK